MIFLHFIAIIASEQVAFFGETMTQAGLLNHRGVKFWL